MFQSKPNYTKLKTNLRLVVNRLKLLEKKRSELAQKARIEIADYIRAGKLDRARIRVEHIVREDYAVEAMEIIEMYADLLLARSGLIETMQSMDPGLDEAISTIIWATPRLQAEVPELAVVTAELTTKYGKEYANVCMQNSENNVSERVVVKMSIAVPPAALIEKYMVVIADMYKVPFEPDQSILSVDDIQGIGASMAADGKTLGFRPSEEELYPPVSVPQHPSAAFLSSPYSVPSGSSNGYTVANGTNHNSGGLDLPEVPAGAPLHRNARPGADTVNFDDLEQRFEALKKKR